jgi:hypothetical protein
MGEKALNHYCCDHSKCHDRAHRGYQWKNWDMREAQPSLQRYMAEGSKIKKKLTHSARQHEQTTFSML